MKKRFAKFVLSIMAFALAFYALKPPSENYIRSRVVQLSSKQGLCSGEQIHAPSGVDYILTAAHCSGLAVDGQIDVTTESGHKLKRKILAEDSFSDLLLLEGVPGMRGLDIAAWSSRGDEVRTFTHGAGHSTYKTSGELIEDIEIMVPLSMGLAQDAPACDKPKNKSEEADFFGIKIKICLLNVKETFTTANIVPGSSGGAVVNDYGNLVGVVSVGDGTFGGLVRLIDIQLFLRNY